MGASLVAQKVRHLPAMQETRVWSLDQEDPLEKDMASHSSTVAWRIQCMEEPSGSDGKEPACNVGDLGWEDLLEKEMVTHSRLLAWRIP